MEGLYSFEIQFRNGKTGLCEKYYIRGRLDPPELISPSNGEVVQSLTPDIDWLEVLGAVKYKIRVLSPDRTTLIHDSQRENGWFYASNYKIPEGVLKPYTSYQIEINAFSQEEDVGSTRFYFTTLEDHSVGPVVVSTNPANGATGVDRNLEWVSITFNKEMIERVSIGAYNYWPTSNAAQRYWSPDKKTFYLSRDDAGSPLPAIVTIQLHLNEDCPLFGDIEGNGLDYYTFQFSTGF